MCIMAAAEDPYNFSQYMHLYSFLIWLAVLLFFRMRPDYYVPLTESPWPEE